VNSSLSSRADWALYDYLSRCVCLTGFSALLETVCLARILYYYNQIDRGVTRDSFSQFDNGPRRCPAKLVLIFVLSLIDSRTEWLLEGVLWSKYELEFSLMYSKQKHVGSVDLEVVLGLISLLPFAK
jgi:hypothetical protein